MLLPWTWDWHCSFLINLLENVFQHHSNTNTITTKYVFQQLICNLQNYTTRTQCNCTTEDGSNNMIAMTGVTFTIKSRCGSQICFPLVIYRKVIIMNNIIKKLNMSCSGYEYIVQITFSQIISYSSWLLSLE